MQTTLLGLSIALIVALVAALIGPYFIDWNQFRPQFEAEASRVIGAPVRVAGELDARLLPTPTLRLRALTVGGPNDLGKIRADRLNVEFSLGELMRGQWRANELTINGLAMDLGLDSQGRIDLPTMTGKFNLGSLSIDRLNLTGRVALHDAASRGTLELNDIAFSGDVRSLAGAVRGDGNFSLYGARYPFRVSSSQAVDGSGTRFHVNLDPGERAVAAELDGVVSFERRVPRFEGTLGLAAPPPPKQSTGQAVPWKISAKVKADPAGAKFEQVETSYGPDETALKASGLADVRFGASPLLHAVLSARQFDADRFAPKDSNPVRVLPSLRAFMAAIPPAPIPTQIEVTSEQIMLGGRPLQNLTAELDTDTRSWTIHRLDVRAPGATHVALDSAAVRPGQDDEFKGRLEIESTDPDALVAWMQGRGETAHRSQKPLRLLGNVEMSSERVAIEALKAEIEGGAVEGRAIFSHGIASGSSKLEAELKAERLDFDAAGSFVRSIAGPQDDWPDEAKVSLDIGRAISAGQELRPFTATFGYDPKHLWLDQLKIGEASGLALKGVGKFNRTDATGSLQLTSTAASLGQLTAVVASYAPSVASRLNALDASGGPVSGKLALDLGKEKAPAQHTSAQAVLELESPQFKGTVTISGKPEMSALRELDLEKLRRGEFTVESKLSTGRAGALLALLGLDQVINAGDGPAQFEGSLSGKWHAPLRLSVRMSGGRLDGLAQGTVELSATEPKAEVNLKVHNANFAPLLGLKPLDALARNVSFSSRLSLTGNRLTFDDLDSSTQSSHLRGHLVVTLDRVKSVEGEVGLDSVDLAPAFALAIGAAGRDAEEPLGPGLVKGWQGRVAFQALRGALPGVGELRPVSGILKSDGSSLTVEAIKAGLGGGEATASIDAREGANGLALSARVDFTGMEGSALHYRSLSMPKGTTSLQTTLTSQGRSVSALTSALSGNGTLTLESAEIAGLDPRAFDVAIRASDSGQVTDDRRLRQIIEPALSRGNLQVASAQIPFTIRDGRLRVGATTLEAQGARAIVSGGYDIPADQADIRASLASTSVGTGTSRPEIQVFMAGSPDGLNRTIDVTALSSWLAVRVIDRETRRLDSIERGEAPPASASISPPSTAVLPPSALPGTGVPGEQSPDTPRRLLPKPRATPLRLPTAPLTANPPIASQQAPPLPPPIELRPAPGPVKPRPRPPLAVTPPQGNL